MVFQNLAMKTAQVDGSRNHNHKRYGYGGTGG
jgi:hypothetical protein